jgi:hypothetical protein
LRSKIVNFIRLHFLYNANEVGGIREIAVVQMQMHIALMRVLVQVVYAFCIEQGTPSFNAMNNVSLVQQEFTQIGAILAGDTGY